jgi:hypothetical protein
MYNEYLRLEQRKKENPGVGYLEFGGGTEVDFVYQDFFAKNMGYIKSHLGHKYDADKTVAF